MPQTKNVNTPANPLWGGRFTHGPSGILEEINTSVHFDKRLAMQDIAGSIAHVKGLASAGIVTAAEKESVIAGLLEIQDEIQRGDFKFDPKLEDVHMNIESSLRDRIGDASKKLHTARSRNDQVALDMKLWTRDQIHSLSLELQRLVETIADTAERYCECVMPGFTHMQMAQPITLGHHLLAYGEMFLRDRLRLADLQRRLNECPLGAAALAGTAHPIDRDVTAKLLEFDYPSFNSIDAVSDRDFVIEFLSVASILSMHMSRLGEEVVTWCTTQFGYATLSEDLSAGSSIMPQKRNPDAAELIRAKSGRVIGSLVSLLIVMKGLPLAYSRDMQEDKEVTFDAADTVHLCVRTTNEIIKGLQFHAARMREDANAGNTLATDLADWLVMKKNIPFREAHHLIGNTVKQLESMGLEIKDATVDSLIGINSAFIGLTQEILSIEHSVKSRNSFGGTSPERVRTAAAALVARNNII